MASNPIKQSPIATLTTAEATGAAVLAFLVAHGVIDDHIAKTYGPYFVLAYVAAFGVVKWWHVMPWSRGQELVAQLEGGRIPDVDMVRLVEGVKDVVAELLDVDPLGKHAVGEAHPDTTAVGEPTEPTLSAGAPGTPTAPTDPTTGA